MRIAVFGATGRTGEELLRLALPRGHQVQALARKVQQARPGVDWTPGDALDAAAIGRTLEGAEAAICLLGPRTDSPAELCSQATRLIVVRMRALGLRRLICVTGATIGHPQEHLGLIYRTLRRKFRRDHPRAAADREAQERAVLESGLEWTLLRPPRLTLDPAGEFRVGADLKIRGSSRARRSDLASVIVRALEHGDWAGQGVAVVSHGWGADGQQAGAAHLERARAMP